MTTAEAISKLRQNTGYTQQEFAEKLGLTVTSISRYENGREPSKRVLKALADLAKSANLGYLHDLFSAKRQADIIARVERLPSAGTARRISFDELSRWRAMAQLVADRMMKARAEYVALIQRQGLTPEDRHRFETTNHTVFALKQVLEGFSRELTPYIDGPTGGIDGKR